MGKPVKTLPLQYPMIQFLIIANVQGIYYLLTESEVFTGKSQTVSLPYWPSDSEVNTAEAEVWDFPVKTERSRLISCLLYGILLWFCAPAIGPWALPENNSLQLANQSAHYIR